MLSDVVAVVQVTGETHTLIALQVYSRGFMVYIVEPIKGDLLHPCRWMGDPAQNNTERAESKPPPWYTFTPINVTATLYCHGKKYATQKVSLD